MDDSGTVADIAAARWGVRPELATARFGEDGWSYEEPVVCPCPRCGGQLHSARKPYESAGKRYRYVALICPLCPATFTLGEVGAKTYEQVIKPVAGSPRDGTLAATRSWRPGGYPEQRSHPDRGRSLTIGGVRVAVGRAALDYAHTLLTGERVRVDAGGLGSLRHDGAAVVRADWPLHYAKMVDTNHLGVSPAGARVRVLVPDDESLVEKCAQLQAADVDVRIMRYLVEEEIVSAARPALELRSQPRMSAMLAETPGGTPSVHTGPAALAARDAFDMMWQALEPPPSPLPVHVPAHQLVPGEWVRLLPHATLNPAQAQAAPHLLDSDGHVLVVAPTGAGKTTIGMIAALRTLAERGRKAAWLVPQRSLTDELDQELNRWRAEGVKVERLSGEYAVDLARAREADVWVATTEKFEALCRASSLRDALADVGCLVVDEIHLLGDAVRGPVLEGLLARVRGADSGVRIVGLSATVANASEVAGWLGATLVAASWRPTRLIWQLPMIPAGSDRAAANAARLRVTSSLTMQITSDDGSVLIFCGSKPSVRATALHIAAARGARVQGVDPADLDLLHRVCASVGVGLHYKEWPFRREDEHAFRSREFDVLVATSTVAAGVNLPARAVIVRDTKVGLDELSVSLVQQMFGRAGRVGAGEAEGYAFLICSENERPLWQQRLVEGYTVRSTMIEALPNQVLAEAVQGRINTRREAEAWWLQTLAYYQGDHDLSAVDIALTFLNDAGYITIVERGAGDADITPTELGRLTARLMVDTQVGFLIRSTLSNVPVPTRADQGEDIVLDLLALSVDDLADVPISDDLRPAVARLLQAGGNLDRLGTSRDFVHGGLGTEEPYSPGDLAKAALKLVAHSPAAFRTNSRKIADIPTALMYPIWEIAPRYLNWLAGQGYLAAVQRWAAIVSFDLARRIRWRQVVPCRGAGRLLWMCEQMATALHAAEGVPSLYRAAIDRGVKSPDWTSNAPPSGCRLSAGEYTSLLRDRASAVSISHDALATTVHAPAGATIVSWHETRLQRNASNGEPMVIGESASTQTQLANGVAVFTRRGDFHANGWLSIYHQVASA